MLKNIRAFFDSRSVIEVETPLLSHYSTTDPHLDSLCSSFREQACYLNTSPEYAMKRLLADNQQAIYQICKAFRDDESGPNHNPEFTMLEWYRPGYDMLQLMDELAELIETLFKRSSIKPGFEYLSYQQAFEKVAGFDPHQTTSNECYQFTVNNNVEIPQGLTVDDDVNDWLDWLLTQRVLPAFNKDGFTFLYDYPASQCALAKIVDNAEQVAVAKRFELFFGEVELANGFFELTDADEQLRRFQQENMRREQSGNAVACIDENFIAALEHGLPDCSGVAVGLDRLLMVLSHTENIDQVLAFSWDRA
ncbi:MAG: elongation factor P--(R)-beta-lysine ligase [Gammaproteobacteria bacterium]|nr:MAG: elongation factor P--(R)-beta-lysine ligase [Gammaproteobacteria bacterium]